MKRLSTWLILAGLLVLLIPVAGALYTNYQQDKLYDEYLKDQAFLSSIQDLDAAFSESVLTPPAITTEEAVEPPAVEQYKPTVLGKVKIPSASIDLLLVEGTSSKDLNWGAGHMSSTPMPGEIGNTAIAGHRNYTFGSYFSRLGEVEIGDTITVEYGGSNYTYEAYDILTVLPDDVSVLKQTKDSAIITLITCTPKGSNTHRLIIHGKLID